MSSIAVATMGDSDSVEVGEQVVAIGNALGYGQSVTTGIISAANRVIDSDSSSDGSSDGTTADTSSTDTTGKTYLQTDAAINPGNSGGALLNMNGEVIGINSAKLASTEVEGMGYAIPVSRVSDIIENLMNEQTRTKVAAEDQGTIGIKCLDVSSQIQQAYNMPAGVYISEVTSGSAAENAGLKSGYVLTSFDGHSITSTSELKSLLQYCTACETVEVEVQVPDNGSYETKTFSLTGAIENTGLIEVPMGTTLREVIYEIGGGIKNGKKFKAVQTGGPSGGCLTEKHLDVPIDFDNLLASGSMMGSGGMIVMDEDDCMVSVAKFYLEFTVEESCGKCTPCRIGTKRMLEILTKITKGTATMEDLDKLEELCYYVKENSACGLGQTAPNPVLSTLRYFRDEYEAHIKEKRCPAGVCKALLSYHIDADKCEGCTLCARNGPVGAISGAVKNPHIIDTDKCVKCGACMEKCKFGAIYKQ